ncbi:MAG: hypothetical protein AB7N80_07720 [Bdellovibrionales bacterium]
MHTLILAFSLFVSMPTLAMHEGPLFENCDATLQTPVEPTVWALSNVELVEVLSPRATVPMQAAMHLALSGKLHGRIKLELLQDMDHMTELPSTPALVMTILAKIGFRLKQLPLIAKGRQISYTPRITAMSFIHDNQVEWNGLKPKQLARVVVKLDATDLLPLLHSFNKSLNHPALGNKLFKLDMLSLK